MSHEDATADLPPQPDPHQDERTRPVPPHIADFLTLLHVFLVYGRHLALTLDARAAAGRFAVIGQFFGTANLTVIRARLARGILRIQALQRVLLTRARRGRDLVWLPPRQPRPRKPTATQPPAAASQPAPRPRPAPLHRRPGPDAAPDLDNLPTLAQLEAQIRRRGVGQSLADICRDLGISPCLCERRLWNALFDSLTWYRGNLSTLMRDLQHRAKAFIPEWDFTFRLGVPDKEPETIRTVIGFFIGERWPRLPSPMPVMSYQEAWVDPKPP
jgi:hypothetical protein